VFDSWYLGYRAPDRALATQIHERLLNSEYRTPDPEDADFFLVPFDARMVLPLSLPRPRCSISRSPSRRVSRIAGWSVIRWRRCKALVVSLTVAERRAANTLRRLPKLT